MTFFNNVPSASQKNFPTHWELSASDAKRDLIIKKIAITLIALINLAALGAALYYIISYCPFPTKALIVSPFIVGVLAALAYLKFPTLGVNSANYTSYLNPLALIGRALAYIFFAPLMYAVSRVDWTPYHDPFRANKISKDLEKLSFKKISDAYGEHFHNLCAYGFIHTKYSSELLSLYQEYKSIKKEMDFWKTEKLEKSTECKKAKERMRVLEQKWRRLKNSFQYCFPHPKKPALDFSKTTTQMKLKARSFCCFGPPINMIRDFHA